MDLTYRIPHSSPFLVPKAPEGRFLVGATLIGPESDPLLRLVVTVMPPLRRNMAERYALWLVDGRGTTNGTLAVRESEDQIRAVAVKFATDFRAGTHDV